MKPEPTFSRDQVRGLFEALAIVADKDQRLKLTLPVSLDTTATISFDGPVGLDELDAVIAHIAFYKTFFKEGENRRWPCLADIQEQVLRRLEGQANS